VGLRRIGSTQRKTQRAKARKRNRPRKVKERARRDARMLTAITGHSLPYVPWVMSWLCVKLEKPSHAITQADVDTFVANAHAQAA
jgi:hypothetical protein